MRWATTSRPSPSKPANAVRLGRPKVAWDTSGSSWRIGVGTPLFGGPQPNHGTDALPTLVVELKLPLHPQIGRAANRLQTDAPSFDATRRTAGWRIHLIPTWCPRRPEPTPATGNHCIPSRSRGASIARNSFRLTAKEIGLHATEPLGSPKRR